MLCAVMPGVAFFIYFHDECRAEHLLLNVVMLNVDLLNVVMLNVVMLCVVMLSVAAQPSAASKEE